jgi:flagellar M-ring protein FliF
MKHGFSQLLQQLGATWKQLGLNQRVSVALTGLVVFGGLLTLGLWSGRPDYALLYGRLDETEAAKVIAALDESSTPYRVATGGSIFVPSDQVHSVRMQLAGKGIPRGEGVGFEIFDKPNFGVSDFVQRANYNRAIQGELARTISQLDSVESARVMIVLPENRLLLDNQRKPTASVFVRLRGAGELPLSTVNAIQLLVANAVEGLQFNQVSVVDNQGNVLSQNQDEDSAAGLSGHQLTVRRNFEHYLSRKAEGMLEHVLGPGQAVVRVSADINWDTVTRFEERFDPEGQVARSTIVDDENVESANAPGGGVPGISGNIPPDTNSYALLSANPSNTTKTKKKTTNSQYEINRSVSSILQSPGGIERLSAAVFVAQRFDNSTAERKATPRSPEELERLRRIVQSALGISESPGRNDQITLEEMVFSDPPAPGSDPESIRQEQWHFWAQLASRLAYPAVALVVFALLWRALRRAGNTFTWPAAAHSQNGHGRASNGNGGGNDPAHSPGEPTPNLITVDVLNRLIRENPANMTQAVRTWLNRGTSAK